jgi:hypothetical protein
MSRLPFVIGTVCVYGLAAHASLVGLAADHVAKPSNIIVDPRLENVVARMLERSPIFRSQAEYLRHKAFLHVRVIVKPPMTPFGQSASRADAVMRKFQFGRVEAVIRLSRIENAPELIAHELEHVREYVEGVQFRMLAARLRTSVWETTMGHYETARAVAIGRRVAEEVDTGIPLNPDR